MAKFPYIVNKNGIWYPSGTEVPESAKPQNKELEQKKLEQPQYTKTEINRMSTGDLRNLATEQGIENAEETSGADLKKMLIEKFGL